MLKKQKKILSQFNNQLKLSKQSWKTHAHYKGRKYFFYQQKVIDLYPYLLDFPQDIQLFQAIQGSQTNIQDQQHFAKIQIIIQRMMNYQIGVINTGMSTSETIHSGMSTKMGNRSVKSKKNKINQSASSSALFDAILAFHYQKSNLSQISFSESPVPTMSSLNFTGQLDITKAQHKTLGKKKRSFTHQPSNSTLDESKSQRQNLQLQQSEDSLIQQNKPKLKIRKMNIKLLPTN